MFIKVEDVIVLDGSNTQRNLQTQNSNGFFCRNGDLPIHMESEGTQTAKTTLKTKNKVGGLTVTDFKTYYKGIVIKKCMQYRHKDRNTEQCKSESPEINSYIYGQLIFNKGMTIQWEQNNVFNK